MKIESQRYNDIIVLQLQGEFTAESLKMFEDAASNAIASRVAGIAIDMSKVVFVDSKALEQLLDLNEKCREHTRQLKLAGLDECCAKIFEITRLLPQFDTYTELTEAVKSFA
ncbi:MAG: STAS domain-containing protein [Planctomycetaceae bacterium]|nr:STAS domain-containing protein [Planctomycetaceae bacterium]